jgi:shikimate dehydrogenase
VSLTAVPAPVPVAHRCAVLGSPIAHSLSPELHTAAYRELGLAGWSYERCEVTEAELAGFVLGRDPSWRGLSLTMPLKVAALRLGEVDPLAALVGAANTLVFTPTGRRVYNTDVGGLTTALVRAGTARCGSATILGAGSTARSSLVSVAQLGATSVTVVARDLAKGEQLRPLADTMRVDLSVRNWDEDPGPSDLIVNTATAGAADTRADVFAASAPVVFDAIYDPWPTALAVAAESAGCVVVNGLDLLVGQAVLQIELMTGRRVEHDVLVAAATAALAARLVDERRAAAGTGG